MTHTIFLVTLLLLLSASVGYGEPDIIVHCKEGQMPCIPIENAQAEPSHELTQAKAWVVCLNNWVAKHPEKKGKVLSSWGAYPMQAYSECSSVAPYAENGSPGATTRTYTLPEHLPDHSCDLICKGVDTYMLFTLTHSGTPHIIQHLSKEACEIAMHRAKGEPATAEEKAEAKVKAAQREFNRKQEQLVWDDAHPNEKAEREAAAERGLILAPGNEVWFERESDITHAECFHLAE